MANVELVVKRNPYTGGYTTQFTKNNELYSAALYSTGYMNECTIFRVEDLKDGEPVYMAWPYSVSESMLRKCVADFMNE